jgi:hypothetical protein
MRSIEGWIERLEPRLFLSAATSHVKPTVLNYYAGAGTINNAISAATAGGSLAPTAPALVVPPAPAAPLVTSVITPDGLTASPGGFSLADLVVDGTITNQPIVVGTNSNLAGVFNSVSAIGLSSE